MPSHYLAIDPGLRTGFARLTNNKNFDAWEDSNVFQVCDDIFEFVDGYDVVICENFIIGGGPGVTTSQPYSLKIQGVVEWACERRGIELVIQNPSDRKVISNEQLKKLGWYSGQKGDYEGHADQAARHLGAYLMTQQDQEFLRRIYE